MTLPVIPRFPDVPGLAKYLEDLSRSIEMGQRPQIGSQPYDPNLQSLSSPFALTAAGLALLDDSDAATQRTTLGLGIGDIPDFADLVGAATNSNAAAGNIGEVILSDLVVGSAAALATGVPKTVTFITLTAGDWNVFGNVGFNAAATTNWTFVVQSISLINNATDATNGRYSANIFPGGQVMGAGAGRVVFQSMAARFSLASPATIYLVAQANFTISTQSAYGQIFARRIR